MTTTRSYSDLLDLDTLEERFRYLAIGGRVGEETFGTERHLNQRLYTSREWRNLRQHIISRDEMLELGVYGHEIPGRPYIHHINPITIEDFRTRSHALFDPENLITCSHQTHNAIHYGDEKQLPRPFVPRSAGDTTLWQPLRRRR